MRVSIGSSKWWGGVLAGALLTGCASAQPAVSEPAAASGQPGMLLRGGEVLVQLETAHGTIVMAVDTERAPITAANFLRYVDGGFYDGGRFHRATREDNYTPNPPNRPMMNIIQGGINPERRSEGFDPIPLERTSVTGIRHVRGVVSMARGTSADTARSDFFILLDDQPSLDFGGLRFEDGQGGAAFGRVVQGLDVVERIQQQPVEGQNLTPPVPITRAVSRRVTGRVELDGIPLPGVRVTLCVGEPSTVVTGIDGSYRFDSAPTRDLTISFRLAGFSGVDQGVRMSSHVGIDAGLLVEVPTVSLQVNPSAKLVAVTPGSHQVMAAPGSEPAVCQSAQRLVT